MAVLFKLKKIVRKFLDGREDPANNRWYARALTIDTIGTKELAEDIAYATTVTPADCLAVLEALGKVMNKRLIDSYAVKLDSIGTFKVGLKCVGADTVEEFSVNSNIKGAHINFTPEYTIDGATRSRVVPMIKSIAFKEAPVNKVERQR